MLTFEDVLGLENEEDCNGELLDEWVEECETGDRWENRVSEITCVVTAWQKADLLQG